MTLSPTDVARRIVDHPADPHVLISVAETLTPDQFARWQAGVEAIAAGLLARNPLTTVEVTR